MKAYRHGTAHGRSFRYVITGLQELPDSQHAGRVRRSLIHVQGCLVERMQGFSYSVEDLEAVVAETLTLGMQSNKRTHALLLIFYQIEGDLDVSFAPRPPPLL